LLAELTPRMPKPMILSWDDCKCVCVYVYVYVCVFVCVYVCVFVCVVCVCV